MAEAINKDPSLISHIEGGSQKYGSLDTIVAIARALKVDIKDIVRNSIIGEELQSELSEEERLAAERMIREPEPEHNQEPSVSIDYVALGKRVRVYRKKRNLTQNELAQAIGREPTWISHVETASRQAGIDTIFKLSRALNVGIADLLVDSLTDERARAEANAEDEDRYQSIRDMLLASPPDDADFLYNCFIFAYQQLNKKHEQEEKT